MVFFDGILCITGTELIRSEQNPSGLISKNTYQSLVTRKRINILRPGKGEGNSALVEFSSLPHKYRDAWTALHGQPPIRPQRGDLADRIRPDLEATAFFNSLQMKYSDNPKGLSDMHKAVLVNTACILNTIREDYAAHAAMRIRNAKNPLRLFWENTSDAIRKLPSSIPHSLPANPRRLSEKYILYVSEGYESLVSKKFANANTQKITPEVGEWLVSRYMSMINRVTVEQLHTEYNSIAQENGWKQIKASRTVREYLHRPEVERIWYAARYGELKAREMYSRQNRTVLPTLRDALWYSDGTKVNFFYRDEKGERRTCYVYEIIDVYSEVFLGYHISDREDFEAQYYAYQMAIRTSGHKPYEIKYDNQGGHKKGEASDFLNNLARHAVRTQPYNGRSKTIESVFGRFQSQFLHRYWFCTGQNITATKKESRANMEFIAANTHKLPTLEEMKAIYHNLREEWNNAPHYKTGVPRIEMYLNSVNEKSPKITIIDMIEMFGATTRQPSTYRSSGIEIQVKNKTYAYEVKLPNGEPDREFNRRNINRRFYVRYTPDNMDLISLYEKNASGEMRFINIAETYVNVKRSIQEQTTEDLSIIRRNELANKLERIEEETNRNRLLEKHGYHPNQHGLHVPKLLGIGKKFKNESIGEIEKEISNITADDEKVRASERAVRASEKKSAQEQKLKAIECDEFTLRRRKILEAETYS